MGRLTKDPELRYTNTNQISVAGFSIAVDRRFRKDKEKETDFVNIVAWQGTAEFVAKNFTKGQPILINGRLQMRNWTDNQGNKRIAYEVVAESVTFAGFKKDQTNVATADFDPYEGTSVPAAA